SPCEVFLQVVPGLDGHEKGLGGGVPPTVRGVEADRPTDRMVLEMLVSVIIDVTNALADAELPARIPGERRALGACEERPDTDQLIPLERLGDHAHHGLL